MNEKVLSLRKASEVVIHPVSETNKQKTTIKDNLLRFLDVCLAPLSCVTLDRSHTLSEPASIVVQWEDHIRFRLLPRPLTPQDRQLITCLFNPRQL